MSRPLYPKTWNTEYVCPCCGHRAPVEFVDPAAYAEDEPITGRDQWALQAALQAAQARLEKSARRALGLVRCPSCHKREPLAARRVYLWAALPLVGASPSIFLVAMIITAQLARRHSLLLGPGSWAAIVTVILSVAVVWRGRRRLLAEAAGAVKFRESGEASG